MTGSDGSSYALPAQGGSQAVSPSKTTTYTATATGSDGGAATAQVTVTFIAATGLQVDRSRHLHAPGESQLR